MRCKQSSTDGRDAVVERLREFIRFNYVTGAEVAQRIGVRAETLYSWLQGKRRPAEPKLLLAFLDALPAESGPGIAPTDYQSGNTKTGAAFLNLGVVRSASAMR